MYRKIHFITVGAGAKIVLVHGYGGSVHHWHDVAQTLSVNYQVIIPNVSHLFLSKEKVTFSKQVDALAVFLKENWKYQKFHLCGVSYGSALVWGVALRYPELADKVVFISPMPPNPMESFSWGILKVLLYLPLPVAALKLFLFTPLGEYFFKTATHVFRTEREKLKNRSYKLRGKKLDFLVHITHRFSWVCRNENWSYWKQKAEQWGQPSMMIFDEKDPLFEGRAFERFAQYFCCDYLVNLKSKGHIMTLNHGKEVADYIVEFLEGKISKIFERRAG
jgi:pimeloyl-ACP methyl ester carboxylesterase